MDEARDFLSRHFYAVGVDVLAHSSPWTATFAVAGGRPVIVGDLRFGVDVRVHAGELGAYHVNLPLTSGFTWHQGGDDPRRATRGIAAVYQPVGETIVDRWDGDCRMIAVKIARPELENQLAEILDAPVRGPVHLEPVLDVTSGTGAGWARLARMIAADAGTAGGLVGHPLIGPRLRESLVTGLILATGHRYREQLARRSPALAAPGAIRRVVEAMRAQPGRPFTVADLAGIAGVGVRSLQQSFRRYAGMPPMAYLRQLRLGLVHDELRLAAPGTTVAQVAYRYGFTHPGRFAATYRQQYGESPTETLHR
ncbi:AraC family transcriptional regulator [Actinoplanes sp. NEAU-A11]|uniref:AraC family transcriptional regulator n=1 Tax=Actinoplanes aureus TaxID=2792083 RepID=A0A931C7N0_9ACTN|nr:AraC family transcriptional regulator [Actinoplanes aureus]